MRTGKALEVEVPTVPDDLLPAECDKKARLLVARISGVGAALAIAFLAAGLFRDP
jgi:hypothetical protein